MIRMTCVMSKNLDRNVNVMISLVVGQVPRTSYLLILRQRQSLSSKRGSLISDNYIFNL